MSTQELHDRIAKLPRPEPGVLMTPPPELIAFTIQWNRHLRAWKKQTLATFAGVSLSTVERAERGEPVRADSLDRIAEALGYGKGYFTAPRLPLSERDTVAAFTDTYSRLQPVRVAPLATARQVRSLTQCQAYLPHCPELPPAFKSEVDGLLEWLDCASFAIADTHDSFEPVRKRELYGHILEHVKSMRRQGLHVLAGTMTAPQVALPDWKVAIVSVSLSTKDPGAPKRKYVFVDERCVALPPDAFAASPLDL